MPIIREKMLTPVAPGVFYTDADLVAVDHEIIAFLKTAASESPLRRARLCAHPAPDALQQDMLIVSHASTYVAPHRHHGKTETLLVLEGRADAVLFDENGTLTEVLNMGPHDSGLTFFYRMPENRYHSLLIRDEWLVFVENTMGPFSPDSTDNAPWAPPPNDAEAGAAYKLAMDQAIQDLRG